MTATESWPNESTSAEWMDAMVAKGHSPKLGDDGKIDMMAWEDEEENWHTGPVCITCGWACCHHCTMLSEIPLCEEALK